MQATANEPIDSLADADGHVIEPGDLWVERLPRDLRPLGPHFYRDERGVFHSKIYGIDIANLEVMHGGIRAQDMLENMGLACAMGVPLERVFASPEPERHTIVDAPASPGSTSTSATACRARCSTPPSCSRVARCSRTSRPRFAPSTTTG